MLAAALRGGLPITSARLFLKEAELPTGAPDVIAVETRCENIRVCPTRKKITPQHLRVLYFLNELQETSVEETNRLLRMSSADVVRIFNELVAAGLVRHTAGGYSSRPLSKIFAARRIIAIEAKMTNWRGALEQAVTNLWFASHSYILLPAMKCLKAVIAEARKLGIGVLVFNGGKTRRVLAPKKQAIPASYGSWMINEWAVHQRS
jgi:hypothetical protein